MASYSVTSPYYGTPIENGYLGFYVPRLIPNHIKDQTYTIDQQYAYRPDLLAYDLYGTPALWWVFAMRNPNTLKDPVYDFVPGVTIDLSSPDYIKMLLGV